MAEANTFSIVRAAAWQALVRRLDAAVEQDGRLAGARDAVLRPVEILRTMALDVPGALGDDVLVADRLRAMLFLCWPFAAVPFEARALLDASVAAANGETERVARLFADANGGGVTAEGWPVDQPAEPGVIDLAGLLVLLLASARVADLPFAPVFLATVHGLALSASAAEVLGRLDPRQPDAPAMGVVLETLYLVESARTVTRNEFIRPFVFDPVERGRWRCLEELFGSSGLAKLAVATHSEWDGATSHEIVALRPRTAAAGETITLTVVSPAGAPPANPLEGAEVVFASPGNPPLPATAKLKDAGPAAVTSTIDLEVTVPAQAAPGWVGFSRGQMISASNLRRTQLRSELLALLRDPCVDGEGRVDPERAIPAYGALATPRRRAFNRFEGGVPVVVFAGVSPAQLRPGEQALLSWETAGAEGVRIEVGGKTVLADASPSGSLSVLAPPHDVDLTLAITPLAVRNGQVQAGQRRELRLIVRAPLGIAAVEVTQNGGPPALVGRPLDVTVRLDGARGLATGSLLLDRPGATPIAPTGQEPGRLTFVVPGAQVEDGLTLTVTVSDDAGVSARRTAGPLRLAAIRRGTVVLVRPAVIEPPDRLDAVQAQRALAGAAEALGLALEVVELPFADDALAALLEPAAGDGDPALLRLLEALARRAVLTPGFEDALWLALVPGTGSLARASTAYAARAVAAATTPALETLLREVYPAGTPATRPRATTGPHLGILGSLDAGDLELGDDDLRIDEIRLDQRGVGVGPGVTTALEVVTTDASGRELDRRPVRVLSTARPAQLALLVPVAAEVVAVELRRAGRTLRVLRRAQGTLSLEVTAPDPEGTPAELDWEWSHTHNARPRVSLLLRRGDLATPVHTIDPCDSHVELPLGRFGGADGLALHATDGWNGLVRSISDSPLRNEAPAVLRRLSDGRFFADVPPGFEVTWRFNGEPRGSDQRTLRLATRDAGLLEFEARRGESVIRDGRSLRAGEAL